MSEFNFKSSVCTSIEQSKRLLALGLKKETADMFWTNPFGDWIAIVGEGSNRDENNIPAWSLWRLIEMLPPSIKDGYHYSLIYDIHRDAIGYICFANGGLQRPYNRLLWDTQSTDPFDNIIVCIEWLIKEGYFNKEYLV